MPSPKHRPVIIIGAGHAGLSASYFLSLSNVNHLLFERGHIAESWHSQRWDSSALNTMNCMNGLPGDETCELPTRDFALAEEFATYCKKYVRKNNLPVQEKQKC